MADTPGIQLVEAYCRAYGHGERTNSHRVSASQLNRRYAAYIAQRRAENVAALQATTAPIGDITPDMLSSLLEEITDVLMTATEAAEKAGASAVSDTLMHSIVRHAGRTMRADTSHEGAKKTGDFNPMEALSRFSYCRCSDG